MSRSIRSERERSRRRALPLVLAAVSAIGAPRLALATLGEARASIEQDGAALGGKPSRTATARYEIQRIDAASGTQIRELVEPGGRVFAVTWLGPAMPDLRKLLGTHFDSYASAARLHANRRHLAVDEPDLVIRSARHGRTWSGGAYVPSLAPQGMSAAELLAAGGENP